MQAAAHGLRRLRRAASEGADGDGPRPTWRRSRWLATAPASSRRSATTWRMPAAIAVAHAVAAADDLTPAAATSAAARLRPGAGPGPGGARRGRGQRAAGGRGRAAGASARQPVPRATSPPLTRCATSSPQWASRSATPRTARRRPSAAEPTGGRRAARLSIRRVLRSSADHGNCRNVPSSAVTVTDTLDQSTSWAACSLGWNVAVNVWLKSRLAVLHGTFTYRRNSPCFRPWGACCQD